MKFQYSPGLFGYGAKGTDGSAGIPGLGLYFSDFNGESNRIQIENAIANDEVLWSSAAPGTKLPGGRVYHTKELFIDPRGYVYEIDAENDTFNDTAGFLNKSQYFAFKTITDNGFDRYSNIYEASTKYIIDTYLSSTPVDYTLTPQRIYGVEPKNFARIEHTDIVDGSYNAFTNYSAGAVPINEDHQAFAIVRDTYSNTFRIGNCTSAGELRNAKMIFDVSSLKLNKESTFNSNTPSGTILTNKEKNAPLLFDPNFNTNPTSFFAATNITEVSINWNLTDFSNDPSIKGTLYFWKKQDPSGTYTINASTSIFPVAFYDIENSGSLKIQNLVLANSYQYKIVLDKDGWERNSTVKTITAGSTGAIMTILDPSSKLLVSDASGWFTTNLSYNYEADISTNSPTGWSASSDQTWAMLARNSSTGPGLASFDISLGYNNTASSRTAVVTIASEAPNASIGITQGGQTAYTVQFDSVGNLTFSPALTNQELTVGIKIYAWGRVRRKYSAGFRTVTAIIDFNQLSTSRANKEINATADDNSKDVSGNTSYNALITVANQSQWKAVATRTDCAADAFDEEGGLKKDDYEYSMVWAEITSVTKTSPVIGGGAFNIGTNKYWYKLNTFIYPSKTCNFYIDASSKVIAMPPFV